MLKGKSVIELTDVHTGQKECYEDTNLVTEAAMDVLNCNITTTLEDRRMERRNRITIILEFGIICIMVLTENGMDWFDGQTESTIIPVCFVPL